MTDSQLKFFLWSLHFFCFYPHAYHMDESCSSVRTAVCPSIQLAWYKLKRWTSHANCSTIFLVHDMLMGTIVELCNELCSSDRSSYVLKTLTHLRFSLSFCHTCHSIPLSHCQFSPLSMTLPGNHTVSAKPHILASFPPTLFNWSGSDLAWCWTSLNLTAWSYFGVKSNERMEITAVLLTVSNVECIPISVNQFGSNLVWWTFGYLTKLSINLDENLHTVETCWV